MQSLVAFEGRAAAEAVATAKPAPKPSPCSRTCCKIRKMVPCRKSFFLFLVVARLCCRKFACIAIASSNSTTWARQTRNGSLEFCSAGDYLFCGGFFKLFHTA